MSSFMSAVLMTKEIGPFSVKHVLPVLSSRWVNLTKPVKNKSGSHFTTTSKVRKQEIILCLKKMKLIFLETFVLVHFSIII